MNDENKLDCTLAIYNNIYTHIRWTRTTQWQVAAVVVGLLAALAGVATKQPAAVSLPSPAALPATDLVFKLLLSLTSVFVALYGIWHLISLQTELTRAREVRRVIECKQFNIKEDDDLMSTKHYEFVAVGVKWSYDLPRLISWWATILLALAYVNLKLWALP